MSRAQNQLLSAIAVEFSELKIVDTGLISVIADCNNGFCTLGSNSSSSEGFAADCLWI